MAAATSLLELVVKALERDAVELVEAPDALEEVPGVITQ
jgi:hypothetical protein